MRWTVKDTTVDGATVSVPASATTVVGSKLYVHDPRHMVIDVTCENIAVTNAITVKLQDSSDEIVWNTKGTHGNVAITGTAAVQTITFDTKANMVMGDYVVITDPNGTAWAVAASTLGVAEVTTITAVADVAASLDGKYFILQDVDGSVAFWIDVDNSGTGEPVHGADRSVEITTIATGDSDVTVGGKLRTAIDADAKFTTSGAGASCIVTNVDLVSVPDATAGDSGFTFVTNTQGSIYGAEPTGAIWTAIPANKKGQADISGATTAANVAAIFETAFDALTGFTSVVTSDDTAADGTMLMTAVVDGPALGAGQVLAADDSAVSNALAIANTTTAVSTGVFSIALMIENSNDQAELPLRPLTRVVVVTGAGDTVDVTGVKVSHWGQ